MSRDAAGWIRALGLTPHPEGGHLRETWRSAEQLPASGAPSRFAGPRAVLTEALYLLQSGERSRLHRLRAEEVWHHLDGGALHLHVFTPGGEYRRHVLGRDLEAGESLQVGVPLGSSCVVRT